jgi:phenylacetate-coenzyme A ligase PaaK-like adenylate-forming protein
MEKVAAYKTWKPLDPGPDFPLDARFAALPALTKNNIREHFPRGMLPVSCDLNLSIARGEINLIETSGTTDDKITNIWNQKWWDASEMASWKLNSFTSQIADGNHREAILVNPKNVGIISDAVDLPLEKRRLARFLYLNEKTDPLNWTTKYMERMVQDLNLYQPAILEANPSYLARLCRFIISRNSPTFQPGAIVFTYEYPAHFHYRQIRQVFPSVPTVSSYGTTEAGYVFMQCEKGNWHQNSEYCRVDFQPFKRDQGGPWLGKFLVTPLRNPWSYILRFDTGDLIRLEESGKCDCGRNSGLILTSLEGRTVNLTLTCQGRLVTLAELDNALSVLENIDEYKLWQTRPGVFELHLVSSRGDKKRLTDEAESLLRKLYGQEAEIAIIFDTAIAPENSGKYLLSKARFPIDPEKYLD